MNAKDFASSKDLTILSVAGWYNQLVQYGREYAHKSRAQGAWSLPVRNSTHQQGGERDHQRGLREVSSCRFCGA
jgi:hypothetical protein